MRHFRAWWARAPRRTVLISAGLLGVIIGLYVTGHSRMVPQLPIVLILLLTIVISIWKPRILFISAICLGFMIGYWRGTNFYAATTRYDSLFDTVVEVVGVISDDVGMNEKGESEFHISEVRTADGQTLPGRIRVRERGSVSYGRGDVLQVKGKLYRTLGSSRQASMTYAEVELLKKNEGLIEKGRQYFFATILQNINDPQASLGLGYLVGLRISIPKDLEENLSVTGLTHIVAVSGYNLTIIVAACRRLFARKSAYQAVVVPGMLLVGFLVITGWSPPIARAAIIAGLSLCAWYYGRVISPILLLLISGAITGFITPFYVWGDVSWYLSFLAFFGVLVFGPLITRRIYKQKEPGIWAQILIETFSAQLFAIPYILYLFGTISVVAPLANLLVLPPTPLIMLGVFLTGITGMVLPFLAPFIAIVPYLLLTFQIWLINFFSSLPWASYQLTISAQTMIGFYAITLIVTAQLWYTDRKYLLTTKQNPRIDWNMV